MIYIFRKLSCKMHILLKDHTSMNVPVRNYLYYSDTLVDVILLQYTHTKYTCIYAHITL